MAEMAGGKEEEDEDELNRFSLLRTLATAAPPVHWQRTQGLLVSWRKGKADSASSNVSADRLKAHLMEELNRNWSEEPSGFPIPQRGRAAAAGTSADLAAETGAES
ncbi:hypothetical protein CIHG_02910 [Coccidioides immitis H538.4]|uniref:Uncharacterized protein n=3 Tax=Coccidioides immitis TaxID=5501 RepID=A0A0J8R3S0_COCIT|nr:hypothetical protein CIRG_07620 [Coccidioides immitis RMSCC 2394]KMU79025.1 hypothetical protein CISG_07332 [Coccidioides immitis RMSCC 3703]KMU85128.1 hypothetical protein CIHG_02910 [Coccidioides immitis H538.4]